MTAASVVVLHRSIPGPLSADPRDRQVFRRLIECRRLGFEVILVPGELLPEGGAPHTLLGEGVAIDGAVRESVPARLKRLAANIAGATLLVNSLMLPRAQREAVLNWPWRVVIDVAHRPSTERTLARVAFGDNEQGGIATEIEHLVAIENQLLTRADVVIVPDAATASGLGHPAVVVPIAGLMSSAQPTSPGGGRTARVVVPVRLSDEWGTPDEATLGELDSLLGHAAIATGDVILAPEDAAARLRHAVKRRWTMAALAESATATRAAQVALDLRSYGVATHVRRVELSSAGVAWIATPAALGLTDLDAARSTFGQLAESFLVDDPAGAGAALAMLLGEPELRAEVVKVQRSVLDPETTRDERPALEEALSPPHTPAARHRTDRTDRADSCEYTGRSTAGTLAAADPRIEALEAEMIPLRLFDRDTSINLQSTLEPDERYRVFARTHLEAPPAATPRQSAESRAVRFSVLVPVYETDPGLLDECIRSVIDQQHRNWDLCLVDDGSRDTAHHDVLRRWATADKRVKLRLNPWNQGIGLTTNDALAMGDGDWIVLLDHDDVLKPDALAWCARYIAACPDYSMWYSDEDKILLDGKLGMPFFKPDWSPDLELGVNYVCHMLCMRAESVRAVGGFRSGFDGAQDFDLVLRLTEHLAEQGQGVGHIAKPLYSWRMIPGSTALATSEKPAAHLAGRRALEDHLDRVVEPATAQDGEYETTHRIRYSVDTSELLSIVIPTRDRVDLLRSCIERVGDTVDGIRHELLIIDNDSADPLTLSYLDDLIAEGHQVVRYPHEFSFARQVNLAALHVRGDLMLVLNNDTWPRNDDWLLRMMEHAQRPEVGLVGARLMFPAGMRGERPQHEGIVMGMAGLAYNIDLGGYMGMNQFVRNTSGVTAAAVMLRPSVLLAVGGLEERLRVAYNDVDFSLRVGEYGYRVVYTPHACLDHPESASRGDMHPGEDEEWLIGRWGPKGAVREPFINPHLEWLMPVFYRL